VLPPTSASSRALSKIPLSATTNSVKDVFTCTVCGSCFCAHGTKVVGMRAIDGVDMERMVEVKMNDGANM
jgi:hypothetical protein